jgi:predicted permease
LDRQAGEGVSDYVFFIATPALVLKTMAAAQFLDAQPWGYWGAYFIGVALVWAVAMWLDLRLHGKTYSESVIAGFSAGQSNTVLVGIPVILKAFGAKIELLWKMIGYSLLMLVAGYLGETAFRSNSVIWGVISALGYAGIVYEVWLGSARKLASNSNDPKLQAAFKALSWFVLVGWAIYPIGYMAIETDGWLRGVIDVRNMDLIYNIGDAVNKIGFGLVIYSLAVSSSRSNA